MGIYACALGKVIYDDDQEMVICVVSPEEICVVALVKVTNVVAWEKVIYVVAPVKVIYVVALAKVTSVVEKKVNFGALENEFYVV